jgi:hypothetical protein
MQRKTSNLNSTGRAGGGRRGCRAGTYKRRSARAAHGDVQEAAGAGIARGHTGGGRRVGTCSRRAVVVRGRAAGGAVAARGRAGSGQSGHRLGICRRRPARASPGEVRGRRPRAALPRGSGVDAEEKSGRPAGRGG